MKKVWFAVIAIVILVLTYFAQKSETFNDGNLGFVGMFFAIIILIILFALITSPIWGTMLYFVYKNKKKKKQLEQKQNRETHINQGVTEGGEKVVDASNFEIKNIIQEKYIELKFRYSDNIKSGRIRVRKIVENRSFVNVGDEIVSVEYDNFAPIKLTTLYSGIIEFQKNEGFLLGHYRPFAIIFPCKSEESEYTIAKIELLKKEQDIINEEKIRIFEEEEEKEGIKQKLIKKKRLRDLEKQVHQELLDTGELDPENKRPPIPKDVADIIYTRDKGRCVYCDSTENIHLDHIIPFSKGGATNVENLQLLCQKCNLQKSNKIG